MRPMTDPLSGRTPRMSAEAAGYTDGRDTELVALEPMSTRPGADRLAATTARLAASTGLGHVDLLAAAGSDGVLWQHEGFGLAGRGVALRIELPRGLTDAAAVAEVAGSLAAIRRSDELAGPGTGAVALGALPFARDAPGALVVPRVVIGRRDGEAWITTIAGPGDGPSAARLAEADGRRRARRVHRSPASAEPVHPDIGDGPRRLGRARGPRRRPYRRRSAGQGRPGPPDRRDGQPPVRHLRRPVQAARPVPDVHGLQGRWLPRRQPRAADRAPWRARRQPPPGRHRRPQRRPGHRRGAHRRAARLAEGAQGARLRHRRSPPHPGPCSARAWTCPTSPRCSSCATYPTWPPA